jgi:hypothetical protein
LHPSDSEEASIAQDGDERGKARQLFEPMRDVDD